MGDIGIVQCIVIGCRANGREGLVTSSVVVLGLLVPGLVAPSTAQPIEERIDAKLRELAAGPFAGVVLVARGEEVLLLKGYGLANREESIPFAPDTVSTIGSITKQFTGAAMLKLAEAGKLDPADPLGRFFDDVPADKADITLHQLLTHTAGFADALGADEEWIGRDEYLERAFVSELLFAPGARHRYSNVGYSILGAVIEETSGASYEAYLRQAFFEPLGMKDTGYVVPDWNARRIAVGYRRGTVYGRVADVQRASGHGFTWHLIGNGGIHSTAGDLHRWVSALRGGRVLSEESLRLLFGRHADEGSGDSFYGYGWVTFDLEGGESMIGHNGGNGYFFADVNFFPERDDLFYAILVNDPRSSAASNWIRRLILEPR